MAETAGHELPSPAKPAAFEPRKSPSNRARCMARSLRTMSAETYARGPLVSLNGIMSSALSALLTNTEALRVTSNNIANMNTAGYARRVINQQAQSYGGQLGGVDITLVQRVIDKYLGRETLSATGSSARYDAEAGIYDQLNGIFGAPGDDTALT